MGSELSFCRNRNRNASQRHNGGNHQMRNNFHPLRFHHVHGDNIRIYKNGTVACRPDGFSKALVFSDRPVMIGEPVYIKFLEISANWSGAVRIGFTSHDPNSIKNKLPKYACPDLTKMNGNWAKALAERMAKKNSILYYYFDANGDVHYGIDSKHYGIFFGNVNTSGKLWAVVDIYGNTVAIELTSPNALATPDRDDSAALIRNNTLHNSPSMFRMMAYIPILFHPTHGRNVSLRSYRRIAVRKSGYFHLAYVFTDRSLKLGEKICLEILQNSSISHGTFAYGITCCDPSTLNPNALPENPEELIDRPEYWIVKFDTNFYKRGDSIVFSTNTRGEITIIKNFGSSSQSFYVDPTQPLWLFFNLSGSVSEVQVVGTSLREEETSDLVRCLESVEMVPKVRSRRDSIFGSSGQETITECVICYENPVNCALYRCGHMCLCYICALKIFKPNCHVICPICRSRIQDVIKIYQ